MPKGGIVETSEDEDHAGTNFENSWGKVSTVRLIFKVNTVTLYWNWRGGALQCEDFYISIWLKSIDNWKMFFSIITFCQVYITISNTFTLDILGLSSNHVLEEHKQLLSFDILFVMYFKLIS